MDFSVGTDIVEIERIRGSVARWGQKFPLRVLTDREYEYCLSKANFLQSLAGRIACKEAVYKALYQLGVSGLSWRDIEVELGRGRAPSIRLSERASRITDGIMVAVSISHNDSQAIAVAQAKRCDS